MNGLAYSGRDKNVVDVTVNNQQIKCEVLAIILFNTTGKLMSVVLRCPDGLHHPSTEPILSSTSRAEAPKEMT